MPDRRWSCLRKLALFQSIKDNIVGCPLRMLQVHSDVDGCLWFIQRYYVKLLANAFWAVRHWSEFFFFFNPIQYTLDFKLLYVENKLAPHNFSSPTAPIKCNNSILEKKLFIYKTALILCLKLYIQCEKSNNKMFTNLYSFYLNVIIESKSV